VEPPCPEDATTEPPQAAKRIEHPSKQIDRSIMPSGLAHASSPGARPARRAPYFGTFIIACSVASSQYKNPASTVM